ncbi:nucleoporin Nup120/160-domain-containing protein [Desarmillaria tabescens]|uniref:Nucleoporin Nup120/160-domain-containing protein n=1 Tax=Armillaria tabescens TaxID=1929756 RepID=A0AA39NLL9_ARMTA|nr:nucleoporin Nup120/160-domain-containing protein [Desarmillaria tabescens]KAK0467905.1 nucleoporin Nup120/160-domain-containing protein [Desarmillaria tabescens]
MDSSMLVAAQLSSLYPSVHAAAAPVDPLFSYTPDQSNLTEHSTFSTVFHSTTTGTILLRVLEGSLLELVSLSVDTVAARFSLPSPVLPSPGIFLWEDQELHIIAVTVSGCVYRLVLPLRNSKDLWRDEIHNVWTREYVITHRVAGVNGVVHIHGTHCVAIGLGNGSLLRLDTEYVGSEGGEGEWTETLFTPGSFLSSLTSFLPAISTGPSHAAEIISIATLPWPTDIGSVWSISRDRVVRFWKPKVGCVASKALPALPGRDVAPSPGPSANGGNSALLESGRQNFLRAISADSDDDRVYLLAFIPTPTLHTSGGNFHLLVADSDHLQEVRTIPCSTESAHCSLQDFIVIGETLHVLWDRQGQSVVDSAVIPFQDADFEPQWKSASYPHEVELTPTYLEEVLLPPGSLTGKCFEVIMRPGMFSPFTLRTAIEDYTNGCLSLPGTPAPQLQVNYATVGEHIAAVVGCTVTLHHDPQTGALLHAEYWNAFKRDWEGFIALCREIERRSRRPLALGVGANGDVIVVERERVASLVNEDLAIHLHNALRSEAPELEPQWDIFGAMESLRRALGVQMMLNLESCLVDVMHQEIAFSLADIIQDQAVRLKFNETLGDDFRTGLLGRLRDMSSLPDEVRAMLDYVGGLETGIKREEDAPASIPPPRSQWTRAITASYVIATTNARYNLCLSIVTLLFFLAPEIGQWDPSLLAEVFALFRGTAIMRYVIRQPSSLPIRPLVEDASAADDVVSLMQNMHVSRNRGETAQSFSLIHRLLDYFGDSQVGLPGAAHGFLDTAGLLQSVSLSHATSNEVVFAEKLRQLGYFQAALQVLSWLPRTAGVIYVLARLYLNVGRADDAAFLLEKLAGCLGMDGAIAAADKMVLSLMTVTTFYIHAAGLFKSKSLVYQETVFTQLAISVAPSEIDTITLWATVIRGYTELALYDDAYAAWISTPNEKQKRENISQLVYRMCEDNAAQKLMTFNFTGFADEVEDALSFKVRNVDPRSQPNYARILYGWYTSRSDHKNDAPTSLADDALQSYLLAINSLSLTDPKNAWILIPGSVDSEHEPRKRQKVKRIPESKYTPGKYENEIVHLEDVQYEYALLSAQVDIVQRHPSAGQYPKFPLPPASIVLRLVQLNCFNLAMTTARSLDVDMSELFSRLTIQCLRLSRDPDSLSLEDHSEWLLTDKVSSWSGTPAEKGWKFLRHSLVCHDCPETDYRYSKIVLETIMQHQKSPPPPWLVSLLEAHHHEYLIRINLRYENFNRAIDHTLSLIRKEDARLARDPPKNTSATWLPYAIIDQVIIAAAEQEVEPPQLSVLRSEISSRMKRMQKLSAFN